MHVKKKRKEGEKRRWKIQNESKSELQIIITNNLLTFWLFVHGVINHGPVFSLRCRFIRLIMYSGLRVNEAISASVQTMIK